MKTAIILLIVGTAVVVALRARKQFRNEPVVEHSLSAPPPEDTQLLSLLQSHTLADRTTEFFGDWKETTVDGVRVAFHGGGLRMDIVAGDFDPDEEQLTDIYLAKVSEQRPLPGREVQRLDRFVGSEGAALAQGFFLNAGPAPDYPELRVGEIRSALLALSDSVIDVGIFETVGVELFIDLSTTNRTRVENDIRQAVSIVRALRTSRVAA